MRQTSDPTNKSITFRDIGKIITEYYMQLYYYGVTFKKGGDLITHTFPVTIEKK